MSVILPDRTRVVEQPRRIIEQKIPSGNVVRQHIPDGDPGARYTLAGMKNVVAAHKCKKEIKAICERITAGARNDEEKIQAILRWVTSVLKYEKDPPDQELVKSPCRILREINAVGRATGDCDDFSVLLASCFKEVGIPSAFMAVSNQKLSLNNKYPPLDHVFACAYARGRGWIATDPVAPGVRWADHRFMVEIV